MAADLELAYWAAFSWSGERSLVPGGVRLLVLGVDVVGGLEVSLPLIRSVECEASGRRAAHQIAGSASGLPLCRVLVITPAEIICQGR